MRYVCTRSNDQGSSENPRSYIQIRLLPSSEIIRSAYVVRVMSSHFPRRFYVKWRKQINNRSLLSAGCNLESAGGPLTQRRAFLSPINFPRESRVVRRVAIHEEFSSSAVETARMVFTGEQTLEKLFKKIGQGEASYDDVHLSDLYRTYTC